MHLVAALGQLRDERHVPVSASRTVGEEQDSQPASFSMPPTIAAWDADGAARRLPYTGPAGVPSTPRAPLQFRSLMAVEERPEARRNVDGVVPSPLLIHIDYYKTGSTWLQRFLFGDPASR